MLLVAKLMLVLTVCLKPNSTVPSTNGASYQQLVTDGNGNTKWEDRLAYETDPVLTEIVPEQNVSFTLAGGDGIMMAYWPPTFNAVEGSTYIVKFDGADYTCTCIRFGEENGPLVLGNLSIIEAGDDTGEPFFMHYTVNWTIFSSDSASEHTISICGQISQLIQIPEKYLPSSAFTKAEWSMVSGKPIDKIELNETVSPDTEININMIGGLTFSNKFLNIDFVPGLMYEINGTITLNYGKTPSHPDTLTVNGLYLADNSAKITLGDLITSYGGKILEFTFMVKIVPTTAVWD